MFHTLPAAVRSHLAAFRMLLVFTVIAGIVYPLAVTGVAQALFGHQANGSLVHRGGHVVGSSLLGQNFDLPKKNANDPNEAPRPDPKWFQPRPSAGGYDPTVSGASNLGPNDPGLIKTIRERKAAVAAFDGVNPGDVPPTRSPPPARASTPTSPRHTLMSRSTGSPGHGAWTRQRSGNWWTTTPTAARSASSARSTST